MDTAVQDGSRIATCVATERPPARTGQTETRAVELVRAMTQLEAAQCLQAIEARSAAIVLEAFGELQQGHADWMADFDAVDTDTCPAETLLDLLERAPTGFARGVIFGKLNLRMQAAAVSGQPF